MTENRPYEFAQALLKIGGAFAAGAGSAWLNGAGGSMIVGAIMGVVGLILVIGIEIGWKQGKRHD